MYKRFLALIATVLPLMNPVFAEVVASLYSAAVPVSDQSESALNRASQAALADVLVKVSGSEEVLGHPALQQALPGARKHVQQYSFSRSPGGERELYARFEFDGKYITRLLTEAQLPIWTANRPQVLVWMTVELAGERLFVSAAEAPEIAEQLRHEFERRGVPAQLPLFDLSDTTALTPDDVWNLNLSAIRAASRRYAVDTVLVGRAVAVSSGEWTGDWSYFHDGDRLDRSAHTNPVAFIQAGAALVAEDMASRYAVVASGGSGRLVLMSVSGVYGYADFAAIVNWLESLELISDAQLHRIAGDRIDLALVTGADARQLTAIIELNPQLRAADADPATLVYQWQK